MTADPAQVWADARARLDGLPDGAGINIGSEAVDRHVREGNGNQVALRCVDLDESVDEYTHTDLHVLTNRFASMLDTLGVRRGETVFSLLGRGITTYVTALGTLKHTSVYSPLFAAFGPEPVRERLRMGRGRVLVTTAELYRRRVAGIRDQLPDLAHVLLVDADDVPGTRSLPRLLADADGRYAVPPTPPETVALLHFTSGTTGKPKGALHVHEAVVAHHATGAYALGLSPGDVFWCTADPGWVTGTSYGIIAPLSLGVTVVCDAAEFDARRWCRILRDHRVTVWYTAPTALRMFCGPGATWCAGSTCRRGRPARRGRGGDPAAAGRGDRDPTPAAGRRGPLAAAAAQLAARGRAGPRGAGARQRDPAPVGTGQDTRAPVVRDVLAEKSKKNSQNVTDYPGFSTGRSVSRAAAARRRRTPRPGAGRRTPRRRTGPSATAAGCTHAPTPSRAPRR